MRTGTPAAVLLTNTLIRDYLLNYARPLIYTTALSNLAVIAASCSFDLLEDGTADRVGVAHFYVATTNLYHGVRPSSLPGFLSIRYTSTSDSAPLSAHHLSRRAFFLFQPTSSSPREVNSRRRSYPS